MADGPILVTGAAGFIGFMLRDGSCGRGATSWLSTT